MSLLRYFMLLSLVIWVGGIICFAFVVAPTLFSVLPARNLLVLGMMVLTLVSQTVVAARMAALRVQMGDIDLAPATDARRAAFNQLHQWSTRLETIVLLLGLATLFVLARQWHPNVPVNAAPSASSKIPS